MSDARLLRAAALTRVTVIGGTDAMTSPTHIETLRRVDLALRQHPWQRFDESAWRGRELGLALLDGLRQTPPRRPPTAPTAASKNSGRATPSPGRRAPSSRSRWAPTPRSRPS
jgi:hypothetical protein